MCTVSNHSGNTVPSHESGKTGDKDDEWKYQKYWSPGGSLLSKTSECHTVHLSDKGQQAICNRTQLEHKKGVSIECLTEDYDVETTAAYYWSLRTVDQKLLNNYYKI